jgi:3-dehydrosphinganine reductase
MLERQERGGKIVFVASQCGLMSCVGYTSYSPSKFAVRGLAEGLRNELLPFQIGVSIAFPGNMKTPGFEMEQMVKPKQTKQIEEGEPLQEPTEVARAMVHSLQKHEFAIYGGNLNGYFLGRMGHGLAPYGNVLLVDVVLAPFLVLAAWVTRVLHDKAARS